MPSLSSDRVNYLIWRYFQEEGLSLSGYALDKETSASQGDGALSSEVAAGQLVSLLLKGMQMAEIEASTGSAPAVPTEVTTGSREVEHSRAAQASQHVDGFDISGLEHVKAPNGVRFIGGVHTAFNAPLAMVIAGISSAVGYIASPNDECSETVLECADVPTCVEPLGIDIQGPGQNVLVGYASGCVRQWQFSDRNAVLQSVLYPKHSDGGPLLLVRASPSASKAAAADAKTGNINIWDLGLRSLVCAVDLEASGGRRFLKTQDQNGAHPSAVGTIAWIGSDALLAVAFGTGIAVLRVAEAPESGVKTEGSAETPERELTPAAEPIWLHGHEGNVSVLGYDARSQQIASGGEDGRVCVWNAQSSEPIHTITAETPGAQVSHVSWLGHHLLTAATSGQVRLWDTRGQVPVLMAATDVGEPVFDLEVSKHMPTHIAVLTPQGCRVLMQDPQQLSFTLVGSVLGKDTQSVAWAHDQSLAVTSRSNTVIVRC